MDGFSKCVSLNYKCAGMVNCVHKKLEINCPLCHQGFCKQMAPWDPAFRIFFSLICKTISDGIVTFP